MRQRGYIIAFIAVLLLACIGGFFGGRLVLERLQDDFAPRAGWTPQASPAPDAAATAPPAPPAAQASPAAQPTATTLIVPAPAASTVAAATWTPTPPSLDAPASLTPEATAAITPTAQPAFPYALARPVRHSTGDCPGVYILGQVLDRSGAAQPNIRLKLTDEYGNPATVTTKANQPDAGRYDFPLFGPPRRFYLQVIDASDRPLSAEVEIAHGLPPNADATCHWVDWRRQ